MKAAVWAAVVGLIASFALGRFWMARREIEAPPRESGEAQTRFVETRSGRTHVLDLGSGDPVLLTHGSGRSVADWQEGFARLLADRHRVVAFDNYGFGWSERGKGLAYGNALWARQAVDVLDALGIERVVIFGHSAGGVVAASVAADHPERIRGVVLTGHGMALDPDQIVPLVPGLGELWAARIDYFGAAFSADHRRRQLAAYRIRGTRAALLVFIRRQYTIDGLRLLRGTYEEIRAPVLQVHGSRDASIPVAAARRLGERIPDARFVEVEGAGHDLHIDASGRLAEEVMSFAAGLAP